MNAMPIPTDLLQVLNQTVFGPCGLDLAQITEEPESQEYAACRCTLQGQRMVSRSAKITPKKAGQFVTFWQRSAGGPIEPLHTEGPFDFFMVQVQQAGRLGQFIFPKAVLVAKGIISTPTKEGKRAFRVYSPWDQPTSKQAQRTQQWQRPYFVELTQPTDLKKLKEFYDSVLG